MAEAQAAAEPDAVAPRFARACLLDDLGRAAEARSAYLDVLARAPGHLGALCRLGNLLLATGRVDAAATAFGEAVARHPDDPAAWVNLGNVLLQSGDPASARGRFEAALRLDGDLAEAHQGLARALDDLGEPAAAERHRRLGYASHPLTTLPYRGGRAPVPVLVLASAGGGNAPLWTLLDDRVFLTSVVITEFFDPEAQLPPHAAVLGAIGDADAGGRALEAAAHLLQRTGAPAINPPAAILGTGRSENPRRLSRIDGVVAPRCLSLPRTLVDSDVLARLGFAFPVLLRAPGFHGGHFLRRVDGAHELADALERLPGEQVAVTAFADTRSPDGWYRKYRVMMVDGRLHPAHLAVGRDWKVHYATSETAARPDLRAEEDAFLHDMAGTLGPAAMAALQRVSDMLALDYGGIDFALRPDGRVVVFEANATMVAQPPAGGGGPRHAAAERIRAALQAMVLARASEASGRRDPGGPVAALDGA